MIINLTPQRRDDALSVSRAGDVLTINGASFDFSSLPEGATLPMGTVPCGWIVGPVTRTAGHIVLTVIVPHGYSPHYIGQPAPIIDPPDGPVTLPVLPVPVGA